MIHARGLNILFKIKYKISLKCAVKLIITDWKSRAVVMPFLKHTLPNRSINDYSRSVNDVVVAMAFAQTARKRTSTCLFCCTEADDLSEVAGRGACSFGPEGELRHHTLKNFNISLFVDQQMVSFYISQLVLTRVCLKCETNSLKPFNDAA